MADAWLAGVVRYAPYLSALQPYLQATSDFRRTISLGALLDALEIKLGSYYFATQAELKLLRSLFEQHPELCVPDLAAAVLENVEADDFPNNQIRTVAAALAPLQQQAERLPAAAPEDAPAEQRERARELAALVRAGRAWVYRVFAKPPAPEKRWEPYYNHMGWTSTAAYGVSNYGGHYVEVVPTAAEKQRTRKDKLGEALQRVNTLLESEPFASRADGLLYELSRCFFFQGEAVAALEALTDIAIEMASEEPLEGFTNFDDETARAAFLASPFKTYQPALERWLDQRALALVRAAVEQGAMGRMLELLRSPSLAQLSRFGGCLLHVAALATTAESRTEVPLCSILAHEELWCHIRSICQPAGAGHFTYE